MIYSIFQQNIMAQDSYMKFTLINNDYDYTLIWNDSSRSIDRMTAFDSWWALFVPKIPTIWISLQRKVWWKGVCNILKLVAVKWLSIHSSHIDTFQFERDWISTVS